MIEINGVVVGIGVGVGGVVPVLEIEGIEFEQIYKTIDYRISISMELIGIGMGRRTYGILSRGTSNTTLPSCPPRPAARLPRCLQGSIAGAPWHRTGSP